MHANKNQLSARDIEDHNKSVESDLSDVGLCSLNIHEFSFNILLCYLMVISNCFLIILEKRIHQSFSEM
jgi:hypothetical protein